MTNPDARRWVVRAILLLGGATVLVVSPFDDHYRRLELVLGGTVVVVGLVNAAIDLLLIFAAKTVKPRKLGND